MLQDVLASNAFTDLVFAPQSSLDSPCCLLLFPIPFSHLLCTLQGVVASNAFPDFIKEEVATQEAARKLLEDRGVAHYWDTAANFDFDAALLPSAVIFQQQQQ
jgi:hypothetical protein